MEERINIQNGTNTLKLIKQKRMFESGKGLNRFVYLNFELIKKLRNEEGGSWEEIYLCFVQIIANDEKLRLDFDEIKTSRKLSGLYQACENYFNKNKQAKQKRTKTVGEKNEPY